MPAQRHIHTTDPVYAPPVLRAPSPTGSLSTEYGPDEGGEENQFSDEALAKHCEDKIGLHKKPDTDREALAIPIRVPIPKPRDRNEEILLHRKIMENLRQKVREVEEEEIYEAHILQRFNPAVQEQPTSNDVDAIMRSMLGPSSASNQSNPASAQPQDNHIASFGGFQALNGGR